MNISFTCDYAAAAHPKIIEAIAADNLNEYPGYGEDARCENAARMIKELCKAPNAAVHLVCGGTLTNLLICAAAMRPHHALMAAASGHVSIHEAGAIEATGHKIQILPNTDGKLAAAEIERAAAGYWARAEHEHIAMPKMVYISHPTEYGTLYTRRELLDIAAVCRRHGLILFADGARMGYGLCAAGSDADLPLFAECCDVFTIGAAKVGALFGEAVIISAPAIAQDFRVIMKQRGAMLSKGWLLGLQFETLFNGGGALYFEGARHAIKMANLLAGALTGAGVPLFAPPATNLIFPVLTQSARARLREKYSFEDWEDAGDGRWAVRFCTSWSTREEDARQLAADCAAACGLQPGAAAGGCP